MQLSVNRQAYLQYQQSQSRKDLEQQVIEFVRFDNDSKLSEQVLREHLNVEAGDVLNLYKIESGIANIYGLDIFESVRYNLVKKGEETGLIIHAKQKSWGTDSLQAGLELSSDLSGQSSFNLGFAYTKQPFNELNGEWRTALQLGEEPAITDRGISAIGSCS